MSGSSPASGQSTQTAHVPLAQYAPGAHPLEKLQIVVWLHPLPPQVVAIALRRSLNASAALAAMAAPCDAQSQTSPSKTLTHSLSCTHDWSKSDARSSVDAAHPG